MTKKKKKKKTENYQYNAADWDESKSVSVRPSRPPAGISTSIRLPKSMVGQLRRVARTKGDIGYQTLLKIWIAERLEKELKKTG